jgi:PAS domain S-box-containing protein
LTIPDIIYRIDPDGNFIFLNDAIRNLGYEPEELIGKHFSEIIYPADVEDVSRSKVLPKYTGKITGDEKAPKLFDERRTGKRKTTGLEIRLVAKGGKRMRPGYMEPMGKELVVVEVNSSGMYEINPDTRNKMFIGTVGVIRDITDRKRTEKVLQQAQQQVIRQEKLAILGQLAGGVAHELRNPLGSIRNTAYFLNMALKKPEPEVKEILKVLEEEVLTSERIISSLLDFARPKAPAKHKVNIINIIQDAMSRVAVPENIEVVSHLDRSLPAILADSDQLVQVFVNIILNAIQAMPDGGRLIVKAESSSSEEVSVSFTDTGGGIPQENLKSIFEPLFTTKAKGIGLGLAVSKLLVAEHGGTIEVKSRAGKGSKFKVRLPIDSRS